MGGDERGREDVWMIRIYEKICIITVAILTAGFIVYGMWAFMQDIKVWFF